MEKETIYFENWLLPSKTRPRPAKRRIQLKVRRRIVENVRRQRRKRQLGMLPFTR